MWWLPKRVSGFAPIPGWIFINRSRFPAFNDLDTTFLGLIFHEAWHQVQMEREGWLAWVWFYLTRPAYRLWWEMEAHVFGDQQKYAGYPERAMEDWVERSVPSYFPWRGAPISEAEIFCNLTFLWESMRTTSVKLEYRL